MILPIILFGIATVLVLLSLLAIFRQNRRKIGMELLERFGKFDSQEFNNFKFSLEGQYISFRTDLQLDELMSWFRQKFQGHFIYRYVHRSTDLDNLKGRFSVVIAGRAIPFELLMFRQPGVCDSICTVKPR